jgi:hypothetical protein
MKRDRLGVQVDLLLQLLVLFFLLFAVWLLFLLLTVCLPAARPRRVDC